MVLEIDFVQYLPVRDRVVISRLVTLAKLVCEAAFRVPGDQPRKVIGHFLHAWISQFGSLFVGPGHLVRIGWVRYRFVGLIHPLRNSAEVEDDGMTLRCLEKVDSHRVDRGEVPRCFSILRRLQFGNSQLWIRQPRNIAHVVRTQVVQGFKCIVMHRRAALQGRIHHNL